MSNAEDVLQAKLQKLSPEQREALLKKLQQRKAKSATLSSSLRDTPIAKIARIEKNYPVSFSQQRLWFLEQFNEGHSAYNIAASFELNGELNIDLLKQSLKLIIQRHESLRTTFAQDNSGVKQQVIDRIEFELKVQDLCHSPDQLTQRIETISSQAFDLEQGPLFDIQLFKLAEQRHVLTVVMHHIISDAWSANVIMSEVSGIYGKLAQGASVVLPAPKIQYIDYSLWQKAFLDEVGIAQSDFWKEELAGFNNLNLPTDMPRPPMPSGNGSFYRLHLSQDLTQSFSQLCIKNGCTAFHGFLAAYQVLLNRYTQQNDFCIGIPVAGRQHSDTEGLIGFFVNSLAIRSDASTELSFSALLGKVKQRSLNALTHQDLPFEKLVEVVNTERNGNISPIFQTFFSYDQGETSSPLNLPGIQSRYLPTDTSSSKFDLSLTLKDNIEGLSCHFEYDTDLYQHETIARIAKHFSRLIQLLVDEPEQALGKHRLLDEDEQDEQLSLQVGFNATATQFTQLNSIQHAFEQQVEQTPDAIAVSDENNALSYRLLNNKANQLANALIAKGARSGHVIAVCLERSCNMSVALLAVLKAGAAYTPLLPNLPKKRIDYIIEDTATTLLISDNTTQSLFDSSALTIINVDDEARYKQNSKENPTEAIDPEALFNVIYTSGSTGEPKGVMVPHRGIINRLQWMQSAYTIDSNDKVLQKTPYNFDVSVWELFWPLMTGAQIVYAKTDGHKDPTYILKSIRDNGITTCHFVPSMLEIFLAAENLDTASTLKQVFASGEALTLKQVELFKQHLSNAKLHNLYGPTEASIDVSYFDCSQDINSSSVPIGKPIANTELYILDKEANLLPKGAIGELYIGGKNLATGYLNKPELTAISFINNPYQAKNQGAKILYKTGDLARFSNNDNIEYLGRIDHQVKIRGLRIELGEIENCLASLEQIESAVATTQKLNDQNILIAYYKSSQNIEGELLRKHLASFLPEYMLPTAFIQLDEIPLSNNGKVDRKNLPSVDIGDLKKQDFIAPRNTIEQELAIIWQDLLGLESVGVLDNFFELGGHSLLASQMLLRIKESFAIELPLRALFEVSDIQNIAKLITALLPDTDIDTADNDEGFEEGIL